MKTIGLIGGMSWESTAEYYRIVNQRVAERLGALHSARCLLYSFDFAEIEALQSAGEWKTATQRMIETAQTLARAGADLLLICTNTMHLMANDVQAAVDVPLLHIADATARYIRAAGISRVGLLGTRLTMERDFYVGRFTRHGLTITLPDDAGRRIVHDVIYNELCRGEINDASRDAYRRIIGQLVAEGCEGITLGCTEIGLLIKQADSPVPIFDTTVIHAEAAVEAACDEHAYANLRARQEH
ncbi:MAG: aspartate/glutamate racemase family protein [Phycisphaerae bacterium]|nr:aspartate/glutamate racemase family protein [Phycisphaerae bacterium]